MLEIKKLKEIDNKDSTIDIYEAITLLLLKLAKRHNITFEELLKIIF